MTTETEEKRESVFSKIGQINLEQSLVSVYGHTKAQLIFEKASSILKNELKNMDDRGNKAIRKHLTVFILPGFACYNALKEQGVDADEAFDFVRKELNKTALRTGNIMKKFKSFPFAFGLMRLVFKPIMKHDYPKEGWTIIWKEISSKRILFDITSCLYCEELKNRNAFELCEAFCQSDHVCYDPLYPNIVFNRSGTIAQGNRVCGFRFEKG